MAEIKRIYFHPQALAQCQVWLKDHLPHIPLIEVESAVTAVERIIEDREGAAIGSSLAANTYGLTVIAEGIGDSPTNVTRFFVIGTGQSSATGDDKTSILFSTAHVPGSLHRMFAPFAKEHINLTRIESYPLRDRIGEYLFLVDIIGHHDDKKTKKCLMAVEQMATRFKILGSYPRGEVR